MQLTLCRRPVASASTSRFRMPSRPLASSDPCCAAERSAVPTSVAYSVGDPGRRASLRWSNADYRNRYYPRTRPGPRCHYRYNSSVTTLPAPGLPGDSSDWARGQSTSIKRVRPSLVVLERKIEQKSPSRLASRAQSLAPQDGIRYRTGFDRLPRLGEFSGSRRGGSAPLGFRPRWTWSWRPR